MLYLSFLWHMHQPYYKNLLTGEVSLPWVRFHGIKDYLDMLLILEKYPKIKATFNLVPSLLDQIEDYQNPEGSKDIYLEISRKKAADLSIDEKAFLLEKFFMLNWDTMVKVYPRYNELLAKRGEYANPEDKKNALAKFSTQDFLDLQVWFNLAWFDPVFKNNIPELKELVKKGKKFSEEDKKAVLDNQLEILKKIIPQYKKMQSSGQIEASITPYYHPIMPLILDTEDAGESMPWATLPEKRCQFPEDVSWHIRNAVENYQKHFGISPKGMWPSEGSVSEKLIPFIIKEGISWIATDEEILWRSLAKGRSGEALYQPYLLERKEGKLNIIFRDHALSDAFGFVYHHWHANQAVDDFLKHLKRIDDHLPKDKNYLVPVILDGENAWEYYANDGLDFLNMLYERLSNESFVTTTTVGKYIEENPPQGKINKLFAGSWINGNFSVWIGQEEKNTSWEYLSRARRDLVDFLGKNPKLKNSKEIELAWRNIYIAEGSDWNWWYGPEHVSATEEEFDRLYRTHLSNSYIATGREVPDFLKVPIISHKVGKYLKPTALIYPEIDGKLTTYYEWVGAGFVDLTKSGTAMHSVSNIARRLWFGFDLENMFLRLDLDMAAGLDNLKLEVYLFPMEAKLELNLEKSRDIKVRTWQKQDKWKEFRLPNKAALDKILEVKFGYLNLGIGHDDEIKMSLALMKNDLVLERIPEQGALKIKLPDPDYEAWNWSA